MKTFKYINIMLLLVLTAFACTDDFSKVEYDPANAKAGELSTLPQSEYVLLVEDAEKAVATFEWGAMDFGFPAAIKYTLEVDLQGNNFDNAEEITTVNATKAEVLTNALNKAMMALQKVYEFEDETPQDVEFRVKGSMSNSAAPLYSTVIKTTVTPYFASQIPETMYMIGNEFGDWTWSNKNVVKMIPVNGSPGKFWAIKYFNTSTEFKWNSEKAWNGKDFSKLENNIGFTHLSSGNAIVSTAGLYMVFMDVNTSTIKLETPEVFGIGDTFGGWNMGTYPMTIEGDKMTITTAVAGALRLYANSSISGIGGDWWRMEFIIIDGKIEYRGNDGDQTKVTVAAGQKVTLDFASDTGTLD